MNRNDAKRIAEVITNEELGQMFEVAKSKTSDWTKVSNINKSITKGVAWNILAKDFDVNHPYILIAKINMIREFGEFLPNYIKPKRKQKKHIQPIHQEPEFN